MLVNKKIVLNSETNTSRERKCGIATEYNQLFYKIWVSPKHQVKTAHANIHNQLTTKPLECLLRPEGSLQHILLAYQTPSSRFK